MADSALPFSWVSLLYVPADQPARIEAAASSGAHAVILDLEDFVPAANKAGARANIAAAARACKQAGMGTVVRINRRMDLAVADLHGAVLDCVDAIMITKAAGAEHIRLLDEVVGALEQERGLTLGRIRFIALIETAAALDCMGPIANACGRMAAIGLGGEDIARECGMRPSAQTLQYPKQKLIFQAVSAGLTPLGYLSSVVDFKDAESFAEMATVSRDFGFQAATCLNHEQVAVINRIYAPTSQAVSRSVQVLEAQAESAGIHAPGEVAAERRRAQAVMARSARVALEQ